MKPALAGDTMLGRSVAERLAAEPPDPPGSFFADEVVAVAREARPGRGRPARPRLLPHAPRHTRLADPEEDGRLVIAWRSR